MGLAAKKSWTDQTAQWLESAIMTWVRDLQEDDETEKAIEVLEKHIKLCPELKRLPKLLQRIRRSRS